MKVAHFQRDILYSQVCFWLTMITCITLAPASLWANSGISYFGHHAFTVAPFELGMFASAYFLLQAERTLRSNDRLAFFRQCLILLIVGVIGVAIAPAVGNGTLDYLHRIFGSLTFITQLIVSVWLIGRLAPNLMNWSLFILQVIGGIVAFIYLQPQQGFSIEGQLFFQLAFSAILFRVLYHADVELA